MSSTISQAAVNALRALSPQDFQVFGNGYIGYVRSVQIEGKSSFALYGADGKLLALNDTADLAALVARHNGLEPMTVH